MINKKESIGILSSSVGVIPLAIRGVLACGTAEGAVALTSGLAGVGSVLGGGMLTGLVMVSAVPIITGVVVFGGIKLYKYIRRYV